MKPFQSRAESMLNFIMDDQFSNEKDLVKEALESVSPTNIRFGIIGYGVSSLRIIRKLGIVLSKQLQPKGIYFETH